MTSRGKFLGGQWHPPSSAPASAHSAAGKRRALVRNTNQFTSKTD